MSLREEMHRSLRRAAAAAAVEDLLARWRAAHAEDALGSFEALHEQLDATCAPFGVDAWMTPTTVEVDHDGVVDVYLLGSELVEALGARWRVDTQHDDSEPLFDDSLEILDDCDFEERWEDR